MGKVIPLKKVIQSIALEKVVLLSNSKYTHQHLLADLLNNDPRADIDIAIASGCCVQTVRHFKQHGGDPARYNPTSRTQNNFSAVYGVGYQPFYEKKRRRSKAAGT